MGPPPLPCDQPCVAKEKDIRYYAGNSWVLYAVIQNVIRTAGQNPRVFSQGY